MKARINVLSKVIKSCWLHAWLYSNKHLATYKQNLTHESYKGVLINYNASIQSFLEKMQLAFLTPPFLGYFFANPASVTPRNSDIL
jgi:hypothetical protein